MTVYNLLILFILVLGLSLCEYKKSKTNTVIFLVLSSTFHKSMLIMIPVYFIAQIPINWKSLLSYSGLAILLTALS